MAKKKKKAAKKTKRKAKKKAKKRRQFYQLVVLEKPLREISGAFLILSWRDRRHAWVPRLFSGPFLFLVHCKFTIHNQSQSSPTRRARAHSKIKIRMK